MMGKSLDQLLRCNVEGFADSQQGEQCNRASGLNHLPMADAEPVRDHVLLGQLPLHPVGPDAMPQGAEESRIAGREIATGAHHSKLRRKRAKAPRTKIRIEWSWPSICDSTQNTSGAVRLAGLPSWYRCRLCPFAPLLDRWESSMLGLRSLRSHRSVWREASAGCSLTEKAYPPFLGCVGIGISRMAYGRP
jgi:hypothetical protein